MYGDSRRTGLPGRADREQRGRCRRTDRVDPGHGGPSALVHHDRSVRDLASEPLGQVALLMLPPSGFSIAEPGYIFFNGLVMIPLAFFCLATGPRYLSAPEVGMFYLLETILAPIWVWLVFAETPTTQTLLGGAILILALIGHSLWQMRSRALRAAVICAE